jgi:UDP-N-acetylmuramate dehydrogenase
MQGAKHANFILNVGNATASEIRQLANHTKEVVREKFGVDLEEEVLYIGDWSQFT